MVTVGGSKNSDKGKAEDSKDPYENLGVKDGEPVYREGEKDGGKKAKNQDGTTISKHKTPQEAADAERAKGKKR